MVTKQKSMTMQNTRQNSDPNQVVQKGGNEFLAGLYGNDQEFIPPQTLKKPKNFSIKKSVTEVDTHNSVSMIFPKILNSISDTNKYLNALNHTNNSSIYQNNQSSQSRFGQKMGADVIKENEDLKGYIKKMQETIQITPQDKFPPDYRGEESSNLYYKHYKKIDKIVQENSFFNVGESPQTILLHNQENNFLLPSKLGVIQEKDDLHTSRPKLKLQNMGYGDNYIDILGKSIKKIQTIKDFELKGNRITKKSSAAILSNINGNALSVDLSNNRIGAIGCSNLSKFVSIKETCKLEYLNLEENYLGNTAVIDLLKGVEFNRTIKYLNLSKNYLSDEISDHMQNFITKGKLVELYLHWNLLKFQFGQMLFGTLKASENEDLRVLDISNNSLGKGELQCTKELAEFLQSNVFLVHLDLSYNYFDFPNTQIISAALETNKTIYGFHFVGNCGYVDSRGFLIPEQATGDLIGSICKKRVNSTKMVQKSQREDRDQYLRDPCWICDGWTERIFEWQKKVSGDQDVDCLFIHFNFEDFIPNFHGKQDYSQSIKYTRMVPQGPLKYFYSNANPDFFFDQKQNKYNKSIQKLTEILNCDKIFQDVDLKNMNYELLELPKHTIMDEDYQPQIQTKPRTRDPIYVPPKKKKKRVIWAFSTSIFAKWRMDDAELINLCFEYDWECSKVPKIIKDPDQLSKAKEFFRERYKFIKDTYKLFASNNPVQDIWAIQISAFSEILEQCKILDQKVTMEFINIKWTAVISGIKGQIMLPAYGVVAGKKAEFANIKVLSVNCMENRLSINNVPLAQVAQEAKQDEAPQEEEQEEATVETPVEAPFEAPVEAPVEVPVEAPIEDSLDATVEIPSSGDNVPRLSLSFQTDKKILMANYNKHLNALSQLPVDTQALSSGKNNRNPDRGLSRYQFMELIVRIADEKYIQKYMKTKNFYEAIEFLWEGKQFQFKFPDNLMQCFTSPNNDSQTWRYERYYNEECDYCLKQYKKIVDYIYKKFSVKKVKPGQQPFMCLDELNAIVVQAGLTELDWFGSQNYLFAFNLSMMTQVDELGSDRIFQMSLIEFYEALARIADEACLPPLEGVYTEEEVSTLQKKMAMPLGHKLEGLMVRLFETCCDPGFKASYPKFTYSFFKKAGDDDDYE